MEGVTLWFTGLPGAGKSTVSELVAKQLRARGAKVELLDGDEVRRTLSGGLGFSREDRDANVRRIGLVADMLSRNGVIAVAALISPYRAAREEVRASMPDRFVEIHVAAPVEVCADRDPKGLYAKAFSGEIDHFTGVSDPYEPPLNPEIVLRTDQESAEQSAERVLAWVESRLSG